MRKCKISKMDGFKIWSMALLSAVFIAGCGDGGSNTPGGGGNAPEGTLPTVSATHPNDAATGVAINRKITATFSKAMDAATITSTTFTVLQGTTPVAGTVTYGATTAVFTPASNLASNTPFTATVTTGMKDTTGNALAANKTWSFTTGATADNAAPTVSGTDPEDLATEVAINRPITATFSEEMDPATIAGANFTVTGPGAASVAGTVAYDGTARLATFTPSSHLAANTIFTATVSTGVKDLAGNALAANTAWSFTTGASAAAGPARVTLGAAGKYVLLAKSAISTTGVTAITGDIGLSPAAGTFLTGFSETLDGTGTFSTSPFVTGKLYAANYTSPTPSNLTTAVLDMQTAYTDAAGRVLPDFTELGAGNIDGKTLVPGLYKWGTGVTIPIGATIAGGANDVWIFQIAQDLNVGNGAIITLSGGAQPKNIFWQVAGQATLGTTSDFKGVILSQTQIVLNTGAAMRGRALAQTAITLDANAVTAP